MSTLCTPLMPPLPSMNCSWQFPLFASDYRLWDCHCPLRAETEVVCPPFFLPCVPHHVHCSQSKLDESLAFQQFSSNVDEEESWINEKLALVTSDEVGDTLATVQVSGAVRCEWQLLHQLFSVRRKGIATSVKRQAVLYKPSHVAWCDIMLP